MYRKNTFSMLTLVLALSFSLSAGFAFPVQAKKEPETFQGVYSGGNRTEIYLLDGGVMMDGVDKALASLKKGMKPNEATPAKTIPAAGVKAISVKSDMAAVVVTPHKGKDIQIETVGVQDADSFSLQTKSENGSLTIDWRGKEKQSYYMNVAEESMVNVLRVSVPEKQKINIAIDQGSGIVLIAEPQGTVKGKTKNGTILVDANVLQKGCQLIATNGQLDVQAGKVDAMLTLEVLNGAARLEAEKVTEDVALSASNGEVSASVDQIENGSFAARNGSVNLKLGTIAGDVIAEVANGKVAVAMTKRPSNLTFHCNYKDTMLPPGWYDGVKFGNAKPTLTVSAASNGYVEITSK